MADADTDETPTVPPEHGYESADAYDMGDRVRAPAPSGGTAEAVVMDADGFKQGAIPDGHVPVYVVVAGSTGYDDDEMAHFPPGELERVEDA